jgi:hypothetical protein
MLQWTRLIQTGQADFKEGIKQGGITESLQFILKTKMPDRNFVIIPHLKAKGIILASGSPRRVEILSKIVNT